MACILTLGGKKSKLYNKLNRLYGEQRAMDMYRSTLSDDFKDKFGEWEVLSEVSRAGDRYYDTEIAHQELRVSYAVDENNEPKLFLPLGHHDLRGGRLTEFGDGIYLHDLDQISENDLNELAGFLNDNDIHPVFHISPRPVKYPFVSNGSDIIDINGIAQQDFLLRRDAYDALTGVLTQIADQMNLPIDLPARKVAGTDHVFDHGELFIPLLQRAFPAQLDTLHIKSRAAGYDNIALAIMDMYTNAEARNKYPVLATEVRLLDNSLRQMIRFTYPHISKENLQGLGFQTSLVDLISSIQEETKQDSFPVGGEDTQGDRLEIDSDLEFIFDTEDDRFAAQDAQQDPHSPIIATKLNPQQQLDANLQMEPLFEGQDLSTPDMQWLHHMLEQSRLFRQGMIDLIKKIQAAGLSLFDRKAIKSVLRGNDIDERLMELHRYLRGVNMQGKTPQDIIQAMERRTEMERRLVSPGNTIPLPEKKSVEVSSEIETLNIPVQMDDYIAILDDLKRRFGVDYVLVDEPNSTIRGLFKNGKVYINVAHAKLDTLFHEYTHPFIEYLDEKKPDVLDKAIEAAHSSTDEKVRSIIRAVKGNYGELFGRDLDKEILVHLIAEHAAGQFEGLAKKEKNIFKRLWNAIVDVIKRIRGIKDKDLTLGYDTTIAGLGNFISKGQLDLSSHGLDQTWLSKSTPEQKRRQAEVVKSILDHSDKTTFIGGRQNDVVNPWTGLGTRSHKYQLSTGKFADLTITSLKDEDKFTPRIGLTQNKVHWSTFMEQATKWAEETPNAAFDRHLFTDYIVTEQLIPSSNPEDAWNAYKAAYIKKITDEMEANPEFKTLNPDFKISNLDFEGGEDKFVVKKFLWSFNEVKSWQMAPEVGTTMHGIMEAMLKRTQQGQIDEELQPYLDDIMRIESKRAKGEKLTVEDQAIETFMNAVQQIIDYANSQDGIIIAEPILHTFHALNSSHDRQTMAGRPDIIIVYPNLEFDTIDLKVSKHKPVNQDGMFGRKNIDVRGQTKSVPTGLDDRRRRKYSEQAEITTRLLETTADWGLRRRNNYVFMAHTPMKSFTTRDNRVYPTKLDITPLSRKYSKSEIPNIDFLINTQAFDYRDGFREKAERWAEVHVNPNVKKADAKGLVDRSVDEGERRRQIDKDFEYNIKRIIEHIETELRRNRSSRHDKNAKNRFRAEKIAELESTLEGVELRNTELEDDLKLARQMEHMLHYLSYAYQILFEGGSNLDHRGKRHKVDSVQYLVQTIGDRYRNNYFSHDDTQNLQRTMDQINQLMIDLESFSILPDILNMITKAPDSVQKSNIMESDLYKNLVDLVGEREKMMETLNDMSKELIAESFTRNMGDDITAALDEEIDARTEITRDQLDRYTAEKNTLDERIKKGEALTILESARYNRLVSKIKVRKRSLQSMSTLKAKSRINKHSIIQDLEQLGEDVSTLGAYLVSHTTINDRLVGLFSVRLKNKMEEARRYTKLDEVEINRWYNDIVKKLVKINPSKYSINDPASIYKNITREVEIAYIDSELEAQADDADPDSEEYLNGGYTTKVVKEFIAPYDISLHNEVVRLQHRIHRLKKTRDNDTEQTIRSRQQQIKKLQRELEIYRYENFEKEYKNDTEQGGFNYYRPLELLLGFNPKTGKFEDNPIAEELKRRLDQMDIDRRTIAALSQTAKAGDLDWELEIQIDRLAELSVKRREMASDFHVVDGQVVKKEGMELAVAELFREYQQLNSERNDYVLDTELYERARKKKAKQLREVYPNHWREYLAVWDIKNSELVFSDSFQYDIDESMTRVSVIDFVNTLAMEGQISIDQANDVVDKYRNAIAEGTSEEKTVKLKEILKSEGFMQAYEDYVNTKSDTQINKLLRPYRLYNDRYDASFIPDVVLKEVRRLEQESQQTDKGKKTFASSALEAEFYQATAHRGDTVGYIESDEYHDAMARAFAEEKSDKVKTPYDTKWYFNNHYKRKDGQVVPIKAWLQRVPANLKETIGTKTKTTELYDKERQLQVDALEKAHPEYDEIQIREALRETEWFKKAHIQSASGGWTPLKKHMTTKVDLEKSYYYVRNKANFKFRKASPKAEYHITPEELRERLDTRDRLKPKGISKTYSDFYSSKGEESKLLQDLHRKMTDHYLEKQKNFDKKDRSGYTIPPYRKSRKDILWQDRSLGKNTMEYFKETVVTQIRTDTEDFEDATGVEISSSLTNGIRHKRLPTLVPSVIQSDFNEVNMDLLSSMQMFSQAANDYEAKRNLLPEATSLLSLVKQRDETGGGVVKKRDGIPMLKRAWKKRFNIDVEDGGALSDNYTSNQYKLLHHMVLGTLFHERNRKISYQTDFFGEIRVDKLLDNIKSIASYITIGGFGQAALQKGVGNFLNAKHQQMVETMAGEYFDAKDIKHAAKILNQGMISRDIQSFEGAMMEDITQSTNMSFWGQLGDMYDVLQSEYRDSVGRNSTGSKRKKIDPLNSAFFYQHYGESRAATSLLVLNLITHRMDEDGRVYNLSEYISKERKRNADISRADIIKSFEQLPRLMDLHHRDEDGILRVKPGVKYGQREDITSLAEYQRLKKADAEPSEKLTPHEAAQFKEWSDEIGASVRNMNKVRNRFHEQMIQQQGNYATFTSPMIKREAAWRFIFLWKDYIVPQTLRRFGSLRHNHHTGRMEEGFYNVLWQKRESIHHILFNMLKDNEKIQQQLMEKGKNMTPLQIANMKRALWEQLFFLFLMAVLSYLMPGDDEEKDDISEVRWSMLYQTERLMRELAAFSPTPFTFSGDEGFPFSLTVIPGIISDNFKVIMNPFSIVSNYKKVNRFTGQLMEDMQAKLMYGHEFERYKRDYMGGINKGDVKVVIALRKMLGNLPLVGFWDNQEAYENLKRGDVFNTDISRDE